MDRIKQMRMVDAQGVVRKVSVGENEDLWWALRGAGGGQFGVVTEFTFSLLPAPSRIINYTYTYQTNADCAKAIVALQTLTLSPPPDGPEASFGGELLVAGEAANDFNGSACRLSGQHIDTDLTAHDALINRFHLTAGVRASITTVTLFTSWLNSLTSLMGNLFITPERIAAEKEQFYAKSLVQPPTAQYSFSSALSLVTLLTSYAGLHGVGNGISFDFLGPQSFSFNSSDSNFNGHKGVCINQFYAWGFPGNDKPEQQREVWEAYDKLVNKAKEGAKGAEAGEWGSYVNNVDARLEGWGKEYYGEGLGRLKDVKKRWDSGGVFWFPQSLSEA